jgi:hypothetical protein
VDLASIGCRRADRIGAEPLHRFFVHSFADDMWSSGMANLTKLPTLADKTHVYAVVETPRGSRAKLKFDPKIGAFTLSKPLLAGLTYPYDWGFIPSTKAPDGDPLDVLIIHEAATYPGLVLACKVIGILEVEQKKKGKVERNDRIFAVPDRRGFEGRPASAATRNRRVGEIFPGDRCT